MLSAIRWSCYPENGVLDACVKHIAEVDGPKSDVSTSFLSENRMWEDISYYILSYAIAFSVKKEFLLFRD